MNTHLKSLKAEAQRIVAQFKQAAQWTPYSEQIVTLAHTIEVLCDELERCQQQEVPDHT